MVHHTKCPPECHLQATTHGRRYVTFNDYCHTQFSLFVACLRMQVPSCRERTQCFQSQAYCSRATWPCCDFTSSDDDEHNTDSNFLLLFADVGITPTLLDGLTEVNVLHIPLVADSPWTYSRFRSNIPLHLIMCHYFTTLSSPHSERCPRTCTMLVTSANWLGPCSLQFSSIMCAPDGDDNLTHTLSLRYAHTCATRS